MPRHDEPPHAGNRIPQQTAVSVHVIGPASKYVAAFKRAAYLSWAVLPTNSSPAVRRSLAGLFWRVASSSLRHLTQFRTVVGGRADLRSRQKQAGQHAWSQRARGPRAGKRPIAAPAPTAFPPSSRSPIWLYPERMTRPTRSQASFQQPRNSKWTNTGRIFDCLIHELLVRNRTILRREWSQSLQSTREG